MNKLLYTTALIATLALPQTLLAAPVGQAPAGCGKFCDSGYTAPTGRNASPTVYPTTSSAAATTNTAGANEQLPTDSTEVDAAHSQQKVQELADQGASNGCSPKGNFGGAMSSAKGQVSGAIKSGVKGLINKAGGALSGAIDLGPLNGIKDQLINEGQKYLSDAAMKFIDSQLGTKLASTAAAAAAAAAPEAAAAAGVGAGAGLGSVPVIVTADLALTDPTKSIDAHAQKIETTSDITSKKTTNLEYKECTADLLTGKANRAALAEITHSEIEFINSNELVIKNLIKLAVTSRDAVAKDVIDNDLADMCATVAPDVKKVALTSYQYKTDWSKRSQCSSDSPRPSTSGTYDPKQAYEKIFNITKSEIGNLMLAQDRLAERINSQETSDLINYQGGIKDKIKCGSNADAPKGTYCDQNSGEVVVNKAQISDTLNRAMNRGKEELAQADEIGEVIDSLMSTITQTAFQSLNGLLSLSQKSGESGNGPSYLDEMVGSTEDDTLNSSRDIIVKDMEGVKAIEEEYADILDQMKENLEDTRDKYSDTASCYVKLSQKVSTTISSSVATDRAKEASSTIENLIDPQLRILEPQFADSKDALDQLDLLMDQAESALTLEDLTLAANAFNNMVELGLLHTATDLQNLIDTLDAAEAVLNTLNIDATAKQKQCKSY